MNYSFDKSKLPQGMSYPLKRSTLDNALKEAGIVQIHAVYYWLRQNGSVVIHAEYCSESNRGRFAAGQSSITVYAVPSKERKETETAMLKEVVPSLCEWLRRAQEAGNVWRTKDQHFVIQHDSGKFSFTEL